MVDRTRTLPDKFRLILISVIVGFFTSVTIGTPYVQLGENFVEGQDLLVCSVEELYEDLDIKESGETEVADIEEERGRTLTTEEHVREFFSGVPIMVEIARCESGFRHYDSDGSVLRGMVNRSDVGVMQINKFYHGDRANQLGLDIFSREGNMAYAMYLYEKQGTTPWQASGACWGQHREIAQR